MSSVAEIQSTLQDAQTHVQTISTKMDNVVTLVQSLKDQIAAGGNVSQADLDNLMVAAQSIQQAAGETEQKEDTLLNNP